MKKKVLAITLISIVCVVVFLSIKLRKDEADAIYKDNIETIATVVRVGWKTVDVSYKINGQEYFYTENIPNKSILTGEQFYALAYKKNFKRALIFYNKPIIDTIKFNYKITVPINVSKPLLDTDYLEFEYLVDGKKYERIQEYFGDVKRPDNFNILKVKYRVDKPEIGYLVNQ